MVKSTTYRLFFALGYLSLASCSGDFVGQSSFRGSSKGAGNEQATTAVNRSTQGNKTPPSSITDDGRTKRLEPDVRGNNGLDELAPGIDDSGNPALADQNDESTSSLSIKDDESVLEFCGRNETKQFETRLKFLADTETCAWSVGDNKAPSSDNINAQQAYLKTIEIGQEVAALCNFSLSTEKEWTQYDDDITMVFDKFAFAGDYLHRSFLKNTAKFDEENGLLVYDHKKVIGQAWPPEQSWLEDGVEGYFNTQQNAASQREGSFDISLTADFIDRLPRKTKTSSEHRIGFYISGNRHATDCQHDGITFDIKVSYVPR